MAVSCDVLLLVLVLEGSPLVDELSPEVLVLPVAALPPTTLDAAEVAGEPVAAVGTAAPAEEPDEELMGM